MRQATSVQVPASVPVADTLKEHPGIGWISCLRFDAIRELVNQGDLQLSLFDQQNLAEIFSENYPGERLIACYNPLMAELRKRKRKELLEATERSRNTGQANPSP